jgi:dihydroflavonol-4-reductase
MKAFITGATGFLGTHVVFNLIKEGWDIIILKRTNSDISEFKDFKNIQYVIGDITDIESLRVGIPEKIDAVFHVAGSVAHLPHHLEHTRYNINVKGTKNMVDVCLEKKIGRFIYTSTVLVYDFHTKKSFNETAPLNQWCKDPYINSKKLAEEEVMKGIKQGLDAVIMQPSAVFGSFDKATWSKMFLEIERGLPFPFAPYGGGSVCHVKKVAEAHVKAFHQGEKGARYILGGPDASWLEIMQEIAKMLDKKGPKWKLPTPIFKAYGWAEFLISTHILRRDPMLTPHSIDILCESVYSDSSLAAKELGYQSSTITEMLQDCHEWMIKVKMLKPNSLVSRPSSEASNYKLSVKKI